jgi:zinc transporter ZupT
VLGWAVGAVTTISEFAIGFLFAFLAGGVVLNVLKEELPEERQSRFAPFALGAAGYGALLLMVG